MASRIVRLRRATARRSGTKTTENTKTSKLFVVFVIVVAFVSAFAAKPLRRDLAIARAQSLRGRRRVGV